MQPGQVVGGRYEVISLIATGGMGAVYRARHQLSKKEVALKIIPSRLNIGHDEESIRRFKREVSVGAEIGHSAIVEVYDAGIESEGLFIAMELLLGESLRERMKRPGVPRTELLAWIDEMLAPLAAAHAKGVVHRDLKPENIFLARDRSGQERIKILDFGIARQATQQSMTQTGDALGTPYYMAPEQAVSAKGATASADVWSVGCLLYEALAGRLPFDGDTVPAVIVKVCTEPHIPLDRVDPTIDARLVLLVEQCLSKDPSRRPPDAAALRLGLKKALGDPAMAATAMASEFKPPGVVAARETGPMAAASGVHPPGRTGTQPMAVYNAQNPSPGSGPFVPPRDFTASPFDAPPSPSGAYQQPSSASVPVPQAGPYTQSPTVGLRPASAASSPPYSPQPPTSNPFGQASGSSPAQFGSAPSSSPGPFGQPSGSSPTPFGHPPGWQPLGSNPSQPQFGPPASGGGGKAWMIGAGIVAVFGLLCCIGGGVALLLGRDEPNPPEQATTPIGFQRYSGPGWSIAVPAGWGQEPPSNPVILVHLLDPNATAGFRNNVNIASEPFAGSLDMYVAANIIAIGTDAIVIAQTPMTASGRPAVEVDARWPNSAVPARAVQLYTVTGSKGYVVTCIAAEVAFEGLRPTCRTIFGTLQLY